MLEKPDKCCLSPVVKVSIISEKSHGYNVMRRALHLCGLPPQNPGPQSNHEKHIMRNPN